MTDPYGPWNDDVDERHHDAPGRRSLRTVFADLVGRYQSARLGTQVAIDVLAACLVMTVVVAGALLVDNDSRPSVTSTAGPGITLSRASPATTTTTAPTTSAPTTTAPTTTTPTTTTTEPPAPPTTRMPRTTTSAPAPQSTAPPPSDAGPPPPTTDGDEEPARPYRDCMEAWLARALPLYAGEPGYSRALDPDGDGEACEWDERDEPDARAE